MAYYGAAAAAAMKFAMVLMIVAMVGQVIEAKGRMKETNMVFYMQDWESGYNISAYPIARLNPHGSVLNFSTLCVIDDPITENMDRNSTEIGRAQGMYVNSAMDSSSLHMLISVVFKNKEYNGSTLEIQGANRFLPVREISVVSGTGYFRYARGYALLETAFVDPYALNAIVKFNVSVRHF